MDLDQSREGFCSCGWRSCTPVHIWTSEGQGAGRKEECLLRCMRPGARMSWVQIPPLPSTGRRPSRMMVLTRRLEQNAAGKWRGRYAGGGKADHYAHAEAYCLRAMTQPEGGFLF